jgi:hypothetical protein
VEDGHDEPKQTEKKQEAPKPEARGASVWRARIAVGLTVFVVVAVASYAVLQWRTSTPAAGSQATVDITLVTADRTDAECVAVNGLDDFHCRLIDENTNWEGEERNLLKPCYTLDRHLYLVPGLFLEPAIRMRYKTEIPKKPRDQLNRFTAHCQIKVVGKLLGVRTHWSANAAWSAPTEAEVGLVSNCTIDG